MSFTVVGSREVEKQLAEIWLAASDRESVTSAANAIERLLRHDPTGHAVHLSEGLWSLSVHPLLVIFEVREADRIVEVASVRRIASK